MEKATGQSREYKASKKSDVYSFGAILLEAIGITCTKMRNNQPPKKPEEWVSYNKYIIGTNSSKLSMIYILACDLTLIDSMN